MNRTLFRICCFFAVLVVILAGWNAAFRFKYGDGIYSMERLYEIPDNQIDVLILGSSRAYENFNTGVLWEEHGLSAYVLSGPVQPMWNTYYYLKEALKTQSPKLIILETFCCVNTEEYAIDANIIKNNYGLHWSKDRLDAIKVSAPEEQWADYLLAYPVYHSRYKDLKRDDFLPDLGKPFYKNFNGFFCNMDTTPMEAETINDTETRYVLDEKTETWYRAVLSLAQERDIPLLAVLAPYAGYNEGVNGVMNTVSDIAASYDADFLNCNLVWKEIGLDYSTDMADSAHLNYRGNQKFTSYIGNYLDEHYGLPDHRNDPAYDAWQQQADFIRLLISDQKLKECTQLTESAELLKNPAYQIFMKGGDDASAADETVRSLLSGLKITGPDESSGKWYFKGSSYSTERVFDPEAYAFAADGPVILVYNTVAEEIADVFAVDPNDGYTLLR